MLRRRNAGRAVAEAQGDSKPEQVLRFACGTEAPAAPALAAHHRPPRAPPCCSKIEAASEQELVEMSYRDYLQVGAAGAAGAAGVAQRALRHLRTPAARPAKYTPRCTRRHACNDTHLTE